MGFLCTFGPTQRVGLYDPMLSRRAAVLVFFFSGFKSSSRKTIESLWEDFFRDPSQFYDLRNAKKAHKLPDFRHKRTGNGLWIDGLYNPPWVGVKLKSIEFLPMDVNNDRAAIIQLVKSCATKKHISNIRKIIADKSWITQDIWIANTLIRSYARCGAVKEAQELFDQLAERDVVSWSALIAGYVELGFAEEALKCFRKMVNDGVRPDSTAYVCSLKACAVIRNLEIVEEIHAKVKEKGLPIQDIVLGTTIVNAYAKCGAVKEARGVFDQLVERDVVSWNAVITAYAEHGMGEEALRCFRDMASSGVTPDSVTFISTIKASADVGALNVVEKIHTQVRQQGLLTENIALGSTLVNAYAKCGAVKESRGVFDQLAERDVVSWNALIAGYSEQGLGEEALRVFREMESDGVLPDSVTYACCLKACAIVGDLKTVEEIHGHVGQFGLLKKDIALGNALVNAYAKCGAVKEAQDVFDQLDERDVISWSALIAAYAEEGFGEEALRCFREMESSKVTPNLVTYVSCLKACATVRAPEIVEKIHMHLRDQGLLNKDVILGTTIVNAYAKCGAVKEAREVFDHLVERDLVSWNALIAGYVDQGCGEEALACFREMKNDGVTPDLVSFICSLKACSIVGDLDIVEEIHTHVKKQGLLDNDIVLGSTLVSAYAKCGAVQEAREVFNQLAERDVVSWSALIAGYTDQGSGEESLKFFRQMEGDKVTPDSVAYGCTLKACAILRALDIVERIHVQVRQQGLLNKDVILGTILVIAYVKCGALNKAQEVFDQLSDRNVESWNALIAGYIDEGLAEEALTCFKEMENDGVAANSVTYVCGIKACATLGALGIVEEIHSLLKEQEILNKDIVVGTTLIYAYAKCGAVKEALEIFDQLPVPDVVSWNALLAGYAQLGYVSEMLELFNRMIEKDTFPDPVTFLVLLNGCSHGALLEEGEQLFDMIQKHCVALTPEHFTCMVDLFGRAGQFDKARCFVVDHTTTLLAFLGSCRKWMNVDLGRRAFDKILQLDEKCVSAYVCMANIYGAAGMVKEADAIEFLREERNLNKMHDTDWVLMQEGKLVQV